MVKSPLRKRHIRDLKADFGKYLVIFMLLILSIAEISGFLVADESMIVAYDESFTKYNVEDGNFTVEKELTQRQINAINDLGVKVYELKFSDRTQENGNTLRIFPKRSEVNLECLMRGEFPSGLNEIAIDRMYADNNGLKLGDIIGIKGLGDYKITGFIALSDYSTMFENNTDLMFDAKGFGVAVVTQEAFNAIDKDLWTWRYAWKYDNPPESEQVENEMSNDFLKGLSDTVRLTDYVPRYQNQAIIFTGEDMGGDRAMMTILLYIIIVIIAFVFGVTISNTIAKEATVIGTLRATGYTRNELIRHYMAMPVVVTVIAATIGNVLGYTVLKDVNANLYYGSYSLPTYVTIWSYSAFIETTVIPLVLMVVITFMVLRKKLKLSPLKFLRRDLSTKKHKQAINLNKRIPFFTRFRLRIVLQNISNYVVLLIGILFANFLLLFSLLFPDALGNYVKILPESMFCDYQYILQLPAGALDEDNKVESMINMMMFQGAVETDNPDAEKFTAYGLKTTPRTMFTENEISIYGINKDSKYLDIDFKGDEVYVSTAYAEKWMIEPGDDIELKEAYEDKTYTFHVAGIYKYDGGLTVFMEQEAMNKRFDFGEGTFTGYFSNTEITDIDEKYIGQVIDFAALSKISRQLDISMGGMMKVVSVFSVIMYVMLIYLLSKTIIEKNATSISMTKILGYTNGEIAKLYVVVTSILVVIFTLVSCPILTAPLIWVVKVALRYEMSGWIPIVISNSVFIKVIIYGLATYAIVAIFEYLKISKVPMEEALKNVE